MGAKRRETTIRSATRGVLWAPGGRAPAFASPAEGICGRQTARNLDLCRHPRRFVGARWLKTRIRGTTRGVLCAPNGEKLGSARALGSGVVGAKPPGRGLVASDGGDCVGDEGRVAPRPGPVRPGRVRADSWRGTGPAVIESLVNGHPMLHISPQSSYLARIAPTTARPQRAQTDTG